MPRQLRRVNANADLLVLSLLVTLAGAMPKVATSGQLMSASVSLLKNRRKWWTQSLLLIIDQQIWKLTTVIWS